MLTRIGFGLEMSEQDPKGTTPANSTSQKSQKRSGASKIPRINSSGSEKVPWGGSLIRRAFRVRKMLTFTF